MHPKVPRQFSAGNHDTFAELRRTMVDSQLRRRGISDPRVLQAMLHVPREEFVLADERYAAYQDNPLPIGFSQTISQPFTVAFQCEALQLQGNERVLEIGAGSGYAAAVLARLAREVFTVEVIPELAEQAIERLRRLGYANVAVFAADGSLGLPQHAPFDGIVVSAGAAALPAPYLEQLAEGGRIVIPIGDGLCGQTMYRFTKIKERVTTEALGDFSFVPLVGKHGWHLHWPAPRTD